MSKLDDLIKERCPNGVKYAELGKVCEITKGRGLSKSDKGTGDIPIILYGELYTIYGNYIDEVVSSASEIAKNSLLIAKNDLLLPVSSTTKEAQIGKASVYRLEDECYLGGDAIRLRHKQNPGFLMYVINSTAFEKQKMKCVSGTTISHLNPGKLSKIKVPIPPLEVQNEIVQILDNFAELTAELTAELSNRKKQYEYYRDLLLNFNENEQREREREVRWASIEDICEISRGFIMSKDFIRDNAGEYPVYSSQTENNGMLGRINTYKYDGDYLTWTTDGANAGTVFRRSGKFSVTNVCGLLKVKDSTVSNDYLYYILSNTAKNYVNSGMGNPKLMSNAMARIKVPIPDNEEQQRIVGVLDRFDKLTSDISEGLPAEIEAREKQYAYYRDKLLSFKELVPNA